MLDLCDRMLKPSAPVEIERIFEEEPREVVKPRVEQKLSVVTPLFELGFKENAVSRRTTKELAETEILLELMASDASPPVSYTHLDVYKRQPDARLGRAGQPAERIPAEPWP